MRQSLSPLQVTLIKKIGYAPRLFFAARIFAYVKKLGKKGIYSNADYMEHHALTA